MNDEKILRTVGLTKSFGGIKAVNRCSFGVTKGSITGLIGPNGSGKTTILNLITGIYHPDEGEIRLNGRRITGLEPSKIAKLGIGRLFQITRVFRKLMVLENLLVAVRPAGALSHLSSSSLKEGSERAFELLRFVKLDHLAGEYAGNLSFGQQKLLEMAMCLMMGPQLILLDEPFAGVNPVMIEELMARIREVNARSTSFLLVEHNLDAVMKLCNPIIVLSHGEIVAEGPPGSIRNDPRVLEAYLGE